ncbi:hypothetical protein [Nocardia sp. CA-290969]
MPADLATLHRIAGKIRGDTVRETRLHREFEAIIEALWRAPIEEVRRAY